ncbi:MAG TPA: hypothetical protein VF163_05350 [Micromonosporaceae bacterium]
MLIAILIALGVTLLALLIGLGWVPDTTQPVKGWYPAGPDPEPWRTT